MESTKPFDLNLLIYQLLDSEPFFAALSRYVTKVKNNSIPTAAIMVDERTGNFVLYYNSLFFETLTQEQKLAVIKHEYYHIILEHVTGRKPTNVDDFKTWNWATDLAINSFLLRDLPDYCLKAGEGPFKDYPPFQAAEWYFKKLKEDKSIQQLINKTCDNGNTGKNNQFDDHSKWSNNQQEKDGGATAKELANERLKEIMRKAIEEVLQKGNNWGSLTQEMRKDLMERVTPKLDWKKVLRYFIKTSKKAEKTGTIRKINKRYAYIHPGRKVNRYAKIAISIDQSGSVNDQMLIAFFSELNSLSKIAEFTVIPFDHQVATEDKIYIWKKNQQHKVERVLQGGTNFDAPTNYVNNHNYDGHIILTDMCALKPGPSKCQRMWITTPECMQNPYFHTNERIIAISS